jgi:hypothetical protein
LFVIPRNFFVIPINCVCHSAQFVCHSERSEESASVFALAFACFPVVILSEAKNPRIPPGPAHHS